MRGWLTVVAATALPGVAAGQTTAVQVVPTADAPVVTLSVAESVDASPDIATVTAGVETLAPTAAAALAQNSTRMTRVIDAIRAAGVPVRDIRTNSVTVSARYAYRGNNQRVFEGYAATNTVAVILRDVARIGPFLDRVTAAGATEVNGPTFAIDEPAPLRARARDRAVARADQEAQAYARRAGFARARLLSITEQGGFAQPVDIVVTGTRVGAPAAVAAPPPPVLGGQQAVGVMLAVTYRLER